MKFLERTVTCYGSGEDGPFLELDNGHRVYGLPASAPDLYAALDELVACYELDGNRNPKPTRTPSEILAFEAAYAALAKARGMKGGE